MKAEPLGTPHWNSRKVCLDRLTQGPNRHGLLYFNAGIMYFICLFLWTFLVGVRINEGFCLVFFYTRTLQSNHCTGADLPVSGFLFKGTLFGILFFGLWCLQQILKHWQTITSVTAMHSIHYFFPANAIKAVWIIDQWRYIKEKNLIIRKILDINPLQTIDQWFKLLLWHWQGKSNEFCARPLRTW